MADESFRGKSPTGMANASRRPAADDDESSVDSSICGISMDDSSSIHSSDYSRSSAEDNSTLKEDSETLDDSLLSRLSEEILEEIQRTSQSEWPLNSETKRTCSTGSSSSTSGSPWLDDDDVSDSSSCSSKERLAQSTPYKSRIERRQFDEARLRMIEHQQTQQAKAHQRQAVAAKPSHRRRQRDVSPSSSSIRTGMDPSKPIDVTNRTLDDDYTIPISHRILEQVRHARLIKAAQSKYKQPRKDLAATPSAAATAAPAVRSSPQEAPRIVGLASQQLPGTLKAAVSMRADEMRCGPKPPIVKYTVPHMGVPATIRPQREDLVYGDTVSSIGGTCGEYRPTFHDKKRLKDGFVGCSRDIEQGRTRHVAAPVNNMPSTKHDPRNTSGDGWLNRRSDLELCLMGLVMSSLATLSVLVALMIVSKQFGR
jgi:hypothetical protein